MESFEWTRLIFQRSLAFIYFLGFLGLCRQYLPLLGDEGLLPARRYIQYFKRLKDNPTLFWFHYSDRMAMTLAYIGLALSLFAMSGFSERFGLIPSMVSWFLLWILYLSFVNIGQTWYGFGWESILLESGFLAIFYGSMDVRAPEVHSWLYRWVLFRVMFGAGMIKLRGDACWWNLTCLHYHYETQPVPNPFSWYFHRLPSWVHKGCVLFTHFVELVVPFAYFAPAPYCYIAAGLTIYFQLMLIISGNLSWLNYLTIVLCITCFDDRFFEGAFGFQSLPVGEMPIPFSLVLMCLTGLIVLLSIRPTINLFSSRQLMNASYDNLHLVNTYGAFGSITRQRNEVVISGTNGDPEDETTEWKEYEFVGKPGNTSKRPQFISPYHLRLDWLMWFTAMKNPMSDQWFVTLLRKILEGDEKVIGLLEHNPFEGKPPKYLRVEMYEYRFTDFGDPKETWWNRRYLYTVNPKVSLPD